MKIAATIAGILLGFIFVVLPLLIMLGVLHQPPPPAGSPPAEFMGVFYPTGWLTFVQLCQIVGGLLVAIPKTRNFGLLILGPIVINILCFHLLVAKGGLVGPPLVVAILAAFLLFAERRKFAQLAN
jgi:putative oxidoreductase